nr:hypothetical protein [Tanacetum cinerariifolium]
VDAAIFVWVALFRLERIEQALGNSKLSLDAKRQWRNAGLAHADIPEALGDDPCGDGIRRADGPVRPPRFVRTNSPVYVDAVVAWLASGGAHLTQHRWQAIRLEAVNPPGGDGHGQGNKLAGFRVEHVVFRRGIAKGHIGLDHFRVGFGQRTEGLFDGGNEVGPIAEHDGIS